MVSETTADATLGRQWMEEGYVVVRGLYSADRAQTLRTISERILSQWRQQNPENA